MTIQQLQYVLEVYRAGSVSQAAKNLFVGQSSVSVSITNLEKELGYPIFTRSKNGVALTPQGRDVVEHAARVCESCRAIANPKQPGCTQIRIASGKFGPGRRASARLLRENRGRRDVAFSFEQVSQSEQIQRLSLFELDLSLCFVFSSRLHNLESRLRAKGLQWQVLSEFPAAIILGPGHPLYRAEKVDLSMLEGEWLIDSTSKSMANSPFLNSINTIHPDRVLAIANPVLRTELLEEGLGYSVNAVTPHRPDNLRRIPLENISFKLLAIYNPIRPMHPEVARFLELLQEELISKENLT